MLPCVCSVIDHRGRQNVVRTSVTHSDAPRVPLFLFLPHFDIICDLLLNRRTATWNLFIKLILERRQKGILSSAQGFSLFISYRITQSRGDRLMGQSNRKFNIPRKTSGTFCARGVGNLMGKAFRGVGNLNFVWLGWGKLNRRCQVSNDFFYGNQSR